MITLAAALFLAAAQPPIEMPFDEYRSALVRIATLLRSGDIATAQAAAGNLQNITVAGPVSFAADGSLLARVTKLMPGQSLQPTLDRLEAAIRSLDARAPASTLPPTANRAALATIRKSWDLELKRGRVDPLMITTKSPPEWLIDRIGQALDAIGRLGAKLWDWLFPNRPKSKEGGMGAAEASVAFVALACGVLGVLAYRAFRSRRRAPLTSLEPEEVQGDRDEDPTSRKPSEWEQHAEALARAGRRREAIRAWYHAVLAATFSGGYLAYAKGRTNWEYIAALSPGLRFRNDVVSMTQLFEGCWYGGRDADENALFTQKRTAQAVLVLLSGSAA